MGQVRPRNVRHRDFDMLRHSDNFKAWLAEQGARLGGDAAYVFDDLLKEQGMTFEQVENIPTPQPPDPEGP